MKKTLTLLFIFISLVANASKYYKSKIRFINGDIKEGYAELPTNKMLDNAIRFKESERGKTTKFKNDEIDNILYYTDSGNKYFFELRKLTMLFGSKKNIKENTKNARYWFLAVASNPAVTYYYFSQTYYIDSDDKIVAKSVDSSGMWATIVLAFKRPNEENPTMIGSLNYGAKVIGEEKRFRKFTAYYFKDEPNLVKRIENKEFKREDIEELIKAYANMKNDSDATDD